MKAWRLVQCVTSTLVLGSVLNCQQLAAAVSAQSVATSSNSQLVPAHLPGSVAASDVLIVSLLDGHVVALDQNTGRVLWTFDSGAPLVSARQSYASSQGGLNVFPGTDGGLYAYHGITHLNPGLERLPISLPELVDSAPSLTADGSLILGRRDSKVFLLDRRTGRSVHTLSNAAEELEDHSASLGLTLGVPPDQLLFLGRQDFMVRSVRMDTQAETWNATFSKLYLLPPGAGGAAGGIKEFFAQEGGAGGVGRKAAGTAAAAAAAAAAPAGGAGAVPSALPHLVVGSDNSLQAYDPHTMLRKWYVEFETPPVSAYRQDGRGGNALDPEQAAAAGGSGRASLTAGGGGSSLLLPGYQGNSGNRPVPATAAGVAAGAGGGGGIGGFMTGRKVNGRLAGGTSVLVGALHGSLYALPADHLMLATAEDGSGGGGSSGGSTTGTAAVVWPKRAGRMPLDITPAAVDVCAAAAADAAPSPTKQRLSPGGSSSSSGGAAAAPAPSPNGSGEGSTDGASALVALLDDSAEQGAAGVVALSPVEHNGVVRDELNTLTCPPLGIHPLTVQQQGRTVGWLPLGAAVDEAPEEPTSAAHMLSSLTAWLAGTSRRLLFTLLAALLLFPMLVYGARGYVSSSSSRALVPAAAGGGVHHHQHLQQQAGALPLALPGLDGTGAAVGAASPSGKRKGSKHRAKAKQQQQQLQQQQQQQQQQQEAAANSSISSSNSKGVDGGVDAAAAAASSSSDGAEGWVDVSSSKKGSKKDGSSSSSSQQQQLDADRAAAADHVHPQQQQQQGGSDRFGGAMVSPKRPPQQHGQQSVPTVHISSPIRSSSPAGVEPYADAVLIPAHHHNPSASSDRGGAGAPAAAAAGSHAGGSSGPTTPASSLFAALSPQSDAGAVGGAGGAAGGGALSPNGGLGGDPISAAAGGGTPGGATPGGGTPHMMQHHHRSYVDADGAVVIGRLRVGPKELGFGSAGTIVYEGVLDSRPVAVKRLLRQFYTLARKEINVLVVSDEHPNVVRCFAMEEDREFVYLALERCKTSLAQFINDQGGAALLTEATSGAPTPWCMSVLSDTAAGLAALHERQIVHRDLKPHNVLLTESGRAKLSDMGLSKQLVSEQSSFESHGSGGSSGWQAPEQLIAKDGGSARQSRAIDVFSLGCIMFYCLSGGKHPFGEHYERDTNIIRGLCNLSALQRWPEAVNLLSAMLAKNPLNRPGMAGVLRHPFWWSDEQRLQFLVDVSDRVENEDREPDPTLLRALEAFSSAAVGSNWGAALDVELVANLGRYRRYDYTCLRDLLRVVRNKRNHFREMPESLQQLMGPLSTGYYKYFSSRFPMLLMAVFFFALQNLCDDPNLAKYFAPPPSSSSSAAAGGGGGGGGSLSALDAGQEPGSIFSTFKRPWDSMAAKANKASRLALASSAASAALAAGGGSSSSSGGVGAGAAEAALAAAAAAAGMSAGKGSRRNSGSMAVGPSPSKLGAAAAAGGHQLPPPGPSAAAARASAGGAAAAGVSVPPGSPPQQLPVWPPGLSRSSPLQQQQQQQQGAGAGSRPPPSRGVESSGGEAAAAGGGDSTSSSSAVGNGVLQQHTQPGAAAAAEDGGGGGAADAANRASGSAAGAASGGKEVVVGYQIAEGQEVLHVLPFPSRPGKQHCDFFIKTGHCKFGEECVFDHPPEFAVPLTEEQLPFRPGQPVCTYYYKTRQCKFGAACKFHHPKLVPILAGSAVQVQQQ